MIFKQKIYDFLRWSERYTGTDMIYLTRGGSWWNLGRVISMVASLGIMIAFGRFVPKETYGAYQYILSITAILGILSLPGLDAALVRAVAQGREKMIIPCFKEKIKWGAIGSLISLLLAFWYLSHQNFNLGLSLLIVAVFLPFINAFLLYLSFWQGKKRFDIQNKYYIFYNLLAAFLLILIILLTDNLILIVFGYFFAFTLTGAIFYKLTIKGTSTGNEEKETISFGKHLTLMQTINVFSSYIDKIILWKLLGPVSVAVYAFAEKPVLNFRSLIPVSELALPKLSQRRVKEIKKELFIKFLKLFLAAILATFLYVLICPYFYEIFFPAYLESIRYSQFLSLIILFSPFALLGTAFFAEMRKKELYLLSFISPSLKIILFLFLIPLFGIWGIIYAVLISHLFGGILTLYLYKNI